MSMGLDFESKIDFSNKRTVQKHDSQHPTSNDSTLLLLRFLMRTDEQREHYNNNRREKRKRDREEEKRCKEDEERRKAEEREKARLRKQKSRARKKAAMAAMNKEPSPVSTPLTPAKLLKVMENQLDAERQQEVRTMDLLGASIASILNNSNERVDRFSGFSMALLNNSAAATQIVLSSDNEQPE
jgi:flagellar biosynthesis GTPase FlhF